MTYKIIDTRTMRNGTPKSYQLEDEHGTQFWTPAKYRKDDGSWKDAVHVLCQTKADQDYLDNIPVRIPFKHLPGELDKVYCFFFARQKRGEFHKGKKPSQRVKVILNRSDLVGDCFPTKILEDAKNAALLAANLDGFEITGIWTQPIVEAA